MEKIFKKSLALMVSAALCLTAFVGCLTVNAEETATPTYTITAQNGKAGDTVEVKVDGTNLTSVCGQQVFINIPAALKINSVKNERGVDYKLPNEAEGEAGEYNTTTVGDVQQVKFVDIINFPATGSDGAIETGEFHIVFSLTIPETAAVGDKYTIGFDEETMFADYLETEITIDVAAATITVQAAQPACDHANATYDYSVVDGNCVTKKVCPDCGNEEIIATLTNTAPTHYPVYESSLALIYRVDTARVADYTNVYAVFTKDQYEAKGTTKIDPDVETVVMEDTPGNSNKKQFPYNKIKSTELSSNIKFDLYGTNADGIEVLLCEEDYSFAQYILTAYNAYNKPTATDKQVKARKLVVNIAYYGAAAQKNFNYNYTESTIPTAILPVSAEADKIADIDVDSFDVSNFVQSGINFTRSPSYESKVLVNINFAKSAATTDSKVVINYKDLNGNSQQKIFEYSDFINYNTSNYRVVFEDMNAATMCDLFEVILYNDNGAIEVGRFTYSMEVYAWQAKTLSSNENTHLVSNRLVCYGRAARDYFADNNG